MKIKRIVFGVRYDGAAYHGWQTQDNLITVQQSLEQAFSQVANHPVTLTCAGRTDAGVHATAQVAHFNTDVERTDYSWVFGANSNLPHDISVTWVKPLSQEFHARYSARARRYRYILFNHSVRPGILRHAVGWYHRELNIDLMQEGVRHLLGEHDFSAFRGAGCQANTPIRTLQQLQITRQRRMIVIDIQANAFLLHMVRNIVGVLIEVGAGIKSPEWVDHVLMSRDRNQAGVTIAPNGLYLVGVDYPQEWQLPKTPMGPFFLNLDFA